MRKFALVFIPFIEFIYAIETSNSYYRLSPVFNVFIANLPQLLDQNHVMGWLMTPPVLAILQHCPCPPQATPPTDHQPPSYSLWYLEPHIRRSWLMSLLVILYKVKINCKGIE